MLHTGKLKFAILAIATLGFAAPSAFAQNICACEPDLYTCQDFGSAEEAQSCFLHCQKQTGGDVHKFDVDGNGKACEAAN